MPNLYPVVGLPPGGDKNPGSPASGPSSSAGARDSASIDPLAASGRTSEPDLFGSAAATGAHEVVVNTPEHLTALADLPADRFAGAVAAWRERMRAHAGASYVHLIVNEGAEAGASLEHSHAQLYALDFVPVAIARERERAAAYHERTMGANLLGDILTQEVRRRERLVAIDEEAALICPWASRSPFELRVVPRRPSPSFEADEVGAQMLRVGLRALAGVFDRPPQLNLWVRTAPRATSQFCWHIDIAPRLTVRAGFELGAGVDVNVYPPERAAADLRAAL